MADLYEPDVGTAYYRSNDSVKNLQIKVRLKRVTSSSIVPAAAANEQKEGSVEMGDMGKQPKLVDEEEICIKWQEKIFSQREIELYNQEANCFNIREKTYHDQVVKIIERGKPTNRIFTYTDDDKFSHEEEAVQFMTTAKSERATILAEKMSHVRQRRVGGRQLKEREVGFVPKINVVDPSPTDDMRRKNHIEAPPMEVMYIMGDLSPRERAAHETDEYILCMLQIDANGVLSIRPDFNRGRKPYLIETASVWVEVFEYTIEHSSKPMNRQEQERERKMYREVYSRHKDFLGACVGLEFEVPPKDALRLVVFGEIESARDFEFDDIYLHFFVDLPKHWTADRFQPLSWVTQTCSSKVEGIDNVAHFSFPFSFELFYKNESVKQEDKDQIPNFPIVLVEVLSLDSWHRFRTEGYTYLQVPCKPGAYHETSHCWRPVGQSISAQLRRFFIGGSPELEDPTYAAVPSTFDGSHLSKFGFHTETSGSLTYRFNVVMQSRAFMERKANKRSVGSLLDNLGITAMQANISSVVDAFKKARMKMMNARHNAERELLRDTKEL
ncbi:Meckel syndrome type 1 protein-like [Haliotis rubra]|uniref:Meckel syndrome type 1 protein-like n=1 Tax=Haliotis rubra TaxID=36100 RepID=UPI001EE5019B|nr:Meckel syndrome type 1 protein-like [Haliotis rubra]